MRQQDVKGTSSYRDDLVAYGTIALAVATSGLAFFSFLAVRESGKQIKISQREVESLEKQTTAMAAQVEQAKLANALPTLLGILEQYGSPESSDARGRLFKEIPPTWDGKTRLFNLQPKELGDDARRTVWQLEHFGALVYHGFVSPEIAAAMWGWTPVNLWKKLDPYIVAERDYRRTLTPPGDAEYACHFEWLAKTIEHLNPSLLRQRILESSESSG